VQPDHLESPSVLPDGLLLPVVPKLQPLHPPEPRPMQPLRELHPAHPPFLLRRIEYTSAPMKQAAIIINKI